jgi:type VI secretion system secreted protein VgrG
MRDMANEYTQNGRPLRVDTELGDDVLLLNGLNGLEAVSVPFNFQLDVLSVQPDIDPHAILRTAVVISLRLPDGSDRVIHGIVSRFAQLGMSDDLVYYRAEVVPWLWFLSLSRESRIYQEMTVPDILEQVFKRAGYADFEFRLTRTPPERPYCVQYRETHLDFISRLLEEEGLFYFFEHSGDRHVLVVADDNGSSNAIEGGEALRFAPDGRAEGAVVSQLEREHRVHSGRIDLRDYDALKPAVRLHATLGEDNEELYDYPGQYQTRDHGDRVARLLLEAEEADRQVVRGDSDSAGLAPAHHFTLREHYRKDANGKYFITQVQHHAHAGEYRAWEQKAPLTYQNEFLAIPHDTPYRPPRRTPRPVIQGTQTAVVVGPKGEEIYVDRHGRVKVQFHWDREGQRDENSSCWIRVATPWAGKGRGAVFLPRIGDEVVVGFEEGEPDRPLIVGSVYNGDNPTPWELPENQTQSGVRSRSSKEGGTENFNEIRLEDKKGQEQIYVHAERNLRVNVEANESRAIGGQVDTVVTGSRRVWVRAEKAVKYKEDGPGGYEYTGDMLRVDGERTVDVKGHMNHVFRTGHSQLVLDGVHNIVVEKGNQHIELHEGSQFIELTDGDQQTTLESGDQVVKLVAGSQEIVLVSGDRSVAAQAGSITETAMKGIELKVGASSIKIDQTGITISGPVVKLEGRIQAQVDGSVTEIGGKALLRAQGGVMMLG